MYFLVWLKPSTSHHILVLRKTVFKRVLFIRLLDYNDNIYMVLKGALAIEVPL